MTTPNTELLALAERMEQAEGPDRELDATIWWLAGSGKTDWPGCSMEAPLEACAVIYGRTPKGTLAWDRVGYRGPDYTASIDAALTLVPEGWLWSVSPLSDPDGTAWRGDWSASVFEYAHVVSSTDRSGHAIIPALALCAAALKARTS